jgi:signal transduction histidine kinase
VRLAGLLLVTSLFGYALRARGPARSVSLMIALLAAAVSLKRPGARLERRPDGDPETLLAVLAHELRSRLATLRGAVDLLRQDAKLAPERRAEILAIVDETAVQLGGLVEDAVLAVRLRRRELPIAQHAVDLEGVIRDVVRSAAAAPQAPAIDVAVQEHLPPASADPVRARQVAANLLQNAIAYAGAGSEVVVSLVRDGDLLRCTFHNDGVGIAPEGRRNLFRPFGTGLARHAGSMGLGLYIAKGLVEAMGGAISYDTTPGQTATFWFTLLVSGARPARG